MSYQAWEDLLEDDDAGTGVASPATASGEGAAASGGPDADALLREAPALAELLRQRGELERRMASLLGGQAPGEGEGKQARPRWGGPPTAAERAAARLAELDELTRRETQRLRAVQRRARDEGDARRRQHLVDRGRRRLLAQQRRLEQAEQRLLEHRLEQAAQRWSGSRTEPTAEAPRRGPGRALADAVDRARAPLGEWKGQREQMQAQLREQLAAAKQDPQMQEALREDPTALDDLDDLGAELDEALALPDAWVERLDAQAKQLSDRLRTSDTWRDRDRRLQIDDALERLDALRQRARERAEAQRKDQRAEERTDARRGEREEAAARDDERRSRRRRAASREEERTSRRDRSSID